MLRFETHIDWRTQHYFLKWEVPLEIFSTEAFYETQFGFLSRPTHRNTTWDAAKFEVGAALPSVSLRPLCTIKLLVLTNIPCTLPLQVCGHKYVDLSEYGYGVALLNDCKYGFAVEGNTMRISLLRGATGPDPDQDQGKHTFDFALVPHREHFLQTDVPQLAAAFNAPLHAQYASQSVVRQVIADVKGPFQVESAPNVILDTVKRGEDDDYLSKKSSGMSVICRLYESKGGHAVASLVTSLPVKSASIVDLLERKIADVEVVSFGDEDKGKKQKKIQLAFRGFQIVTVKLELDVERHHASKLVEEAWTEVSARDGGEDEIV